MARFGKICAMSECITRTKNGVAGLILPILTMFAFAHSAQGVTVRTKSDARLWQTVDDRAAPLEWPWADGADSAVLVFSNRVSNAVSSTNVVRAADEFRGSCPHAVTDPSEEALVDVTLVQKSSGAVVEESSETLAYVNGAGGGPIKVRVKGTADWKRVKTPRVFAFDSAWYSAPGESGYDIAPPYDPALRLIIR